MSFTPIDISIHSPSDLGSLLNEGLRRAGLFIVRKAKTALFTVWTDDAEGAPVGRYVCTGTFAATLVAANAGDASGGRMVRFTCVSGTLTITPDGSDTIDGASTLALSAGEHAAIQSDGGTNWETIS
jgi:hypothetical protein